MAGTIGKPVTRSAAMVSRISSGNANDFSSTRVAPSLAAINT